MQTNLSKPNWKLFFATYIFLLICSLIVYGYNFPRPNILEQIPIIFSLFNPELYQHDFYVQEMLQFTPRYYYYYLIYFTAQLGFSIPIVCFFYYILSFSSFILGLYAIGNFLTRSRFSAAVLAFLGLTAANGTIGFVDLFRTEPIPSIYAIGVAIWGIYFCFRQKFIWGYFLFGIACILQFLVGFLPGVLMAPVILFEAKKKSNFWTPVLAFTVLGILVCFIYLPMIVTGNTDSGKMSDAEFVYLYGMIRHPHHIIFSRFGLWGSRGWFNLILFIFGGLFCINRAASLQGEDKVRLSLVVFTSVLLLVIGYVFVEIYPLAFIAKLQLARTTPFAQLMILIAISALVAEQYKSENIPLSFLWIIATILGNGGILLFILVISLWSIKLPKILSNIDSKILKSCLGLLFFSLMIMIYSYNGIVPSILFFWSISLENDRSTNYQKNTNLKFITLISSLLLAIFMILYHHYDLFLFLILLLPCLIEKEFFKSKLKQTIIYILAFLSSLLLILGLTKSLPKNLAAFFQDRVKIYPVATDELTKLAVRFKQLSPKDALVLVPPSDESFRFYSRRAVVFSFKSFPFTDRGIQEWKKRLKAIFGAIEPGQDLDLLFSKRSSSELVTIAKQFKANYILTRVDWHPDIKGVVIDREGDWILYKL